MIMGVKLTNEQFQERIKGRFLSEPYTRYEEKGQFTCQTCDHRWTTKFGIVARGFGCPSCGLVKARETKKWNLDSSHMMNKIPESLRNKISISGEYSGYSSRLHVQCLVCKYEWDAKPTYLYTGYGCYKCGHAEKGKKMRTTHQGFCDKVASYHGDKIEVLSLYSGGSNPIKFKCTICNEEQFKKRARGLLKRGCTYCNFSKGEEKIKRELTDNAVSFVHQYKFDDIPLYTFDFAIFDENGLLSHVVEYDGEQHYRAIKAWGGADKLKRQKEVDAFKNDYCLKNNIRLIRVSYKKFKSLSITDVL